MGELIRTLAGEAEEYCSSSADLSSVQQERRLAAVRYIGSLTGRYVLASRQIRTDTDVKVFACRVKSITPHRVVLAAPVCGIKGDWATVHAGDLGLLKLKIESLVDFGFAGEISASPEQRQRLATRIEWVKKRSLFGWSDQREHRRVMPKNPRGRLLFGNGTWIDCFVIDISRSGAAISADISPRIGLPLAIGKVLGRVVRHLDVGFAVQFLELQDETSLEALLTDRD